MQLRHFLERQIPRRGTEFAERVVRPGPAAAEAEVVPLDDRLRPELPDEHVLEERLRAEREQRRARSAG